MHDSLCCTIDLILKTKKPILMGSNQRRSLRQMIEDDDVPIVNEDYLVDAGSVSNTFELREQVQINEDNQKSFSKSIQEVI